MSECEACGAEMAQRKKGPPRRTCSDKCRQRARRVPNPSEQITFLTTVVDSKRGVEAVAELVLVSYELGIMWRRVGRSVPPNLGWRCEAIGVGLLELVESLQGEARG